MRVSLTGVRLKAGKRKKRLFSGQRSKKLPSDQFLGPFLGARKWMVKGWKLVKPSGKPMLHFSSFVPLPLPFFFPPYNTNEIKFFFNIFRAIRSPISFGHAIGSIVSTRQYFSRTCPIIILHLLPSLLTWLCIIPSATSPLDRIIS